MLSDSWSAEDGLEGLHLSVWFIIRLTRLEATEALRKGLGGAQMEEVRIIY